MNSRLCRIKASMETMARRGSPSAEIDEAAGRVKRLETNNKRLLPPQAIAGKVRISRKKRISKIALTKDFCFFLSIALHGLGVSSPEFVTGMRGDSDFFLSCMMLLL